eukprot:m.183445 g.183445  ORF g.183445 m.183445 type:complete len:67 (+) comp16651_c1_seq7:857-1057(+)
MCSLEEPSQTDKVTPPFSQQTQHGFLSLANYTACSGPSWLLSFLKVESLSARQRGRFVFNIQWHSW